MVSAVFNLVPNVVVIVLTSAVSAFELILLDKFKVSLFIRLLNMADVSAIFNLVSKDESK